MVYRSRHTNGRPRCYYNVLQPVIRQQLLHTLCHFLDQDVQNPVVLNVVSRTDVTKVDFLVQTRKHSPLVLERQDFWQTSVIEVLI